MIKLGRAVLRFSSRLEEVHIAPSSSETFGLLFGRSLPMRQLFSVLKRVAPTEATVLILGETGTGKDICAHAIHEASLRAAGPLVVFDGSAVTPELVSSELFGHVEGAFTGATRRHSGAFETAAGGTIFLDEIGELPLDVQPKLLRALENREVRPVGSSRPVPVDVRVVAATHQDLEGLVREGRFREDLYYRLAVVRIELSPLRQRPEDLEGLVQRLLASIRGRGEPVTVSPEALAVLGAQAWPGNVRELRNLLECAVALGGGPRIETRDLLVSTARELGAPRAPDLAGQTLEQIEKEAIRQTLERCGGSQKDVAHLLGIHPNTLRLKLRQYGLKQGPDEA